MRSPLNSVIGFSTLLQKGAAGPLSAEQERFIGQIRSAGLKLSQLIDDILDYALLVETTQLKLEPSNVSVVVRQVVGAFSSTAQAKGIGLELDCPPELPQILADVSRLTRALTELLDNALKFTESGGQVVLKAVTVDDSVEITFRDTGIGISPDQIGFVFEPFRQVDNSAARIQPGLGLGLAMARRIVELHRGTLAVESVLGGGSTFAVRLPLASEPSETPRTGR